MPKRLKDYREYVSNNVRELRMPIIAVMTEKDIPLHCDWAELVRICGGKDNAVKAFDGRYLHIRADFKYNFTDSLPNRLAFLFYKMMESCVCHNKTMPLVMMALKVPS